MNPIISIIVPVYMAEEYLHICINSVITQSFQNWELLLVDDGSKDKSGEICEYFSKKDSRIRVIHKENGGAASARNLGIYSANGYWISFLDSDDWLAEDYLQRLFSASSNTDCVMSGFIKYFQDGKTEEWNSIDYYARNRREIGLGMVDMNNHHLLNSMSTKLFKSCIIKDNHICLIPGLSVSEDMIFVHEYIKHCQSVTCVSYSGYFYRRDIGNSLSNTKFSLDKYLYSREQLYKLRNEFIDLFLIEDPNYEELVLKGYFDSTIYCQRGLRSILSIGYYKNLFMLIDDELLRKYVSNYKVTCSLYDEFMVECIKRKSVFPAIKRLFSLVKSKSIKTIKLFIQ